MLAGESICISPILSKDYSRMLLSILLLVRKMQNNAIQLWKGYGICILWWFFLLHFSETFINLSSQLKNLKFYKKFVFIIGGLQVVIINVAFLLKFLLQKFFKKKKKKNLCFKWNPILPGQALWHTCIIPTLRRLRWKDGLSPGVA
jgi:hypothetical protein